MREYSRAQKNFLYRLVFVLSSRGQGLSVCVLEISEQSNHSVY